MNKKYNLRFFKILFRQLTVTFMVLFFLPTLLFAARATCSKTGNYITRLGNGTINWSTGRISAKGTASPLKEDKSKTSSSIPGAAKTDAIVNLISILKNIKISKESVKEFVASNDNIMAQIENTMSDVSAVDQHYTSDGALEIKIATSMYGSFLQSVLPHDISRIPEIKSIETSGKIQQQRGKYTGLVLDARGLGFKPLLYPLVMNEQGDEVYSALFINREYAVQYGVCKYFCSMEKAAANKRVGNNPLILKGLRAGEGGKSIILNKPDAEKIERIIERHSFFKECRVIIVLDQ